MRLSCHFFFGVPCCERLLPSRILSVAKNVPRVSFAPSVLQADTLVIVGTLSKKQVPFLLDAWSHFAFPARVMHLAGCQNAIKSYALLTQLQSVINLDLVINVCSQDDDSLKSKLVEAKL